MTERRPLVIVSGRRQEMPAGDTIPTDVLPAGGEYARWTPTLVAEGDTFTIPEHAQMLTIAHVVLDGLLVIDGTLILADPEPGCVADAAGDETSDSEDVTVNYVVPSDWWLAVHGAANTDAGVVAAWSDSSDSTYLQGADDGGGLYIANAKVGFSDLVAASGRDIESFEFIVRCSNAVESVVEANNFAGITDVDMDNFLTAYEGTGIQNITVGPFTRDGGGTWTEAEINALICTIDANADASSAPRVYRVRLRVTYA